MEMSTEKKASPFTAKNRECPVPTLETQVIGSSGDPEVGSGSETAEMIELRLNAESLINHWGQDIPATPEDVTPYTINRYFGKGLDGTGWKGEFPVCQEIAVKKGSSILTQFAYYYSLVDYITTTLGFGSVGGIISDLVDSIVPAEVMKMYSHYQTLAQDWQNINLCISNWKDFRFCTENPMAVLNSVDAALQNLEQSILVIDGAIDHIMDVYDTVSGWFDKGGAADKLEDFTETLSEKFANFAENIADKLANLPQSVMNAFLNCQFIQNLFSLPRRILTHCASAAAIVMSIRAPMCLMDFVRIIQKLRAAVAEMKNCAATIQNTAAQIQNIKNMITQGNWIGVLGQLNSGKGPAKQGVNIIEHPSSFGAKYPHNSAFTTHGGHILELDNTKGRERIHIQHKKGTSVELSPEGDMHSKVKKDFQLMVEGNIEINSNKKVTITGKDGVKIDYGGTTFQMDKSSMGMGGDFGSMNCNQLAVTSESASIASATTLTMGSALETNVCATKSLYLSSMKEIVMMAPLITIVATGPMISMVTMSGMIVGAGTAGVGFISTANTAIVAAKVGMYGANASNIIAAGVNIIGGPSGV